MNKRHAVYLISAVLVTALAVFMNETETPSATFSTQFLENNSTIITEEITENPGASIPDSLRSDLASSLAGTHHGVQLKSRHQQLIITASLKDLFDYYLSAAGEESTEEINQRVKKELAGQLKTEALAQAIDIWNSYLTYKRELVEFDQQYPAYSSQPEKREQLIILQQRQLALIALQDQIMGASIAEIIFKFDRQLDGYTLEKAELLASDLNAEQIQQRLINLSAQLPIDTILSVQRNEQQKALVEINQQEGLSVQQKFQQREQQVGAVAASRLQELDEKRAIWKGRIIDFKQEQQQLQQAGLANEEYKVSLDKLYTQHFSQGEQLRARALTTNHE